MKKNTTLFILLICVVLLSGCAPTYQKLVAYDHIESLRQGVVLVPLSSGEEKASRLDRYGLKKRAKKVRKRTQKQSLMIMEAFAERFQFCPVYFCMEEDVAPILDDGKTGRLLGESLQYLPDLGIDPDQQRVFLVSVDPVWVSQGDNDKEVEMLILRDEWGNGLQQPFPASAEIGSNLSRSGLKSAVRVMDQNLHRFYEQRNQYVQRQSRNKGIRLFQ